MWLLNTNNAVLEYFPSPQDVPGGYAILSHAWDTMEDNFQDMMKLRAHHKGNLLPADPFGTLQPKTIKACELARGLGLQYIWIDVCCDERSHVAALSKDIQSQYLYFSLAHVCFVYLRDVPSGRDPTTVDSPFQTSKWHTLPWSLQELVAPDLVIFYSKEWNVLGTKQSLAPTLEGITGIPAAVLTFEKEPSSFGAAARMLWASKRDFNLARQEEQAYSLVGIMGINMDVLGSSEGPRAFQRLQEEIIKQLRDTTVFVWGSRPALSFAEVTRLVTRLPPQSTTHIRHAVESYLFAPSPLYFNSTFAAARTISGVPIGDTAYTLDTSNLLTFDITPNAIRARLPVFELGQQRILIAFISCSLNDKPLGLVLTWCPDSSAGGIPLYDVGIDNPDGSGVIRLVTLEGVTLEAAAHGKKLGGATFTWRTIDIRGQHIHSPSQNFQRIPMNRDLSSFYIERNVLSELGGRFLPHKPLDSASTSGGWRSRLASALKLSLPDPLPMGLASPGPSRGNESLVTTNGSLPATFLFFAESGTIGNGSRGRPFLVHFGRCRYTVAGDQSQSGDSSGALWATVEQFKGTEEEAQSLEYEPGIPSHKCSEHHISDWENQQKKFPILFEPVTYGIVLSFRISGAAAFNTGTKVLLPSISISYAR